MKPDQNLIAALRLSPVPVLVSKVELAECLNVRVTTIEYWQTKGKLKAAWHTPGGSPRYWYPPKEALFGPPTHANA